jgi:hypothetical protein
MSKRVLNHKFQKKDIRDFVHPASISHEIDTIVNKSLGLDKPVVHNENGLDKPVVHNTPIKATTTKTTLPLPPNFIGNKIFTVKNYGQIQILDQGDLGSCVACSFAQCVRLMTNNSQQMSRILFYFNGRGAAGYVLEDDTGLTVRDGCKSLSNYGTCPETSYPYDVAVFANLPPLRAYTLSTKWGSFVYSFVRQNLTSLKNCLVTTNAPIVFAIIIYSSFMTEAVSSSGVVPMPNVKTETSDGGHCVCMVGYNDTKQLFICANSWGTSWGNKGIFYLPYAYVTNPFLASDFCSISFSQTPAKIENTIKTSVPSPSPVKTQGIPVPAFAEMPKQNTSALITSKMVLQVPSLRVPSLPVPSLQVPSLQVPSLQVPNVPTKTEHTFAKTRSTNKKFGFVFSQR